SFVIMMFNIPIIGGTTAHAVGAVFIAIVLGPWAACISISAALLIQALVFGDGGILAFGVNCFNMAVVMPFVGYAVYRLIAGKSRELSKRTALGTLIGSYIGINSAALFAAVEFGIQPIFFKTAEGLPLYCPYPLPVTIPAMLFSHGLFAGPLEAVVTVSALALVSKYAPDMFNDVYEKSSSNVKTRKVLIGIFSGLVLLTPLGLLASGTAWGEWNPTELKSMLGYIPQGIAKAAGKWSGIIPDYSLAGIPENLVYIFSAVIGIVLIFVIMLVTSKIVLHFKKADRD
ncbi:MAG TPA: cobalt transporter CbiM, partial [Ruminiclostridium sp.]|nr:cobalt transporter CbiM [Ruminiclostridium sp.]